MGELRLQSLNLIPELRGGVGERYSHALWRGVEEPTYFVILFFFLKKLSPKCDLGGLFGDFLQHAKVVRPSGSRGGGQTCIMSYALRSSHSSIDGV